MAKARRPAAKAAAPPAPQADAALASDPALPLGPEPTGAGEDRAASAPAPVDQIAATARKRGPVGWAVTVTGPAKGRWRIGRHFGPQPVTIPVTDLTEEDVARLKADPLLICTWPG